MDTPKVTHLLQQEMHEVRAKAFRKGWEAAVASANKNGMPRTEDLGPALESYLLGSTDK